MLTKLSLYNINKYGPYGDTFLDGQFQKCKWIRNKRNGYIGYLPKKDKVGCQGCKSYLACDSNHVLHGRKFSKCRSDGTWKPPLGDFYFGN